MTGNRNKRLKRFHRKVQKSIGGALMKAQSRAIQKEYTKAFRLIGGEPFIIAEHCYAALRIEIIKIIKPCFYSQKEASMALNVKQPEISALLGAKFQRFSRERLAVFLNKLNQKVTFPTTCHPNGELFQEVTITWKILSPKLVKVAK